MYWLETQYSVIKWLMKTQLSVIDGNPDVRLVNLTYYTKIETTTKTNAHIPVSSIPTTNFVGQGININWLYNNIKLPPNSFHKKNSSSCLCSLNDNHITMHSMCHEYTNLITAHVSPWQQINIKLWKCQGYISWKRSICDGWRMSSAERTYNKEKKDTS